MGVVRARGIDAAWPLLVVGALGRRDEGPEMKLAEHLGELRSRLIKSVLASAMTPSERRTFLTALPFVGACFAVGVLFGYFLAAPMALQYLLGMTADGMIRPEMQAQPYIDFVTTFLLGLGAAFQLPVVLWVLARLGLVTAERLVRFRKYAFLGAFVLAAILTPTPDPLNQALIAVPLWVLYEVGIMMARLAGR